MEPQLLPLTAFLTPTDKRARSLRVPQRFMVLPDHVNVQRLGPKATRADYACREAGCVWKKEAIAAKAARRHAGSAHPGLPCHIFEGVPRQEVLEQYATNHRARCKLWRDQHSEAQPPLRKRTREASRVSREEEEEEVVEAEEGKADENDDEEEDDYEPERNLFPTDHGNGTGRILGVVSFVRHPGHGSISVTGHVAPDTREAVDVAISWVSSQVKGLWRWLGGGRGARGPGGEARRCPVALWRSDETLLVSFSNGSGQFMEGGSLGAATALSLVSMLTRRRVKSSVAVTGLLDLSGHVLTVSGLEAKLRACQAFGIETFLVPVSAYQSHIVESLPVDVQVYALRAVRTVRTMVDVIRLSIEDCPPLPVEMRPMGLVPSVGLGYGVCYGDGIVDTTEEQIGRLVFEAVSRPRGSGRLIFTGGDGREVLTRMANAAFEWAMVHRGTIEEELGRRPGGPVVSRNRDIHVHLRNGGPDMKVPPVYCPAMAVALASLLSGRLPLEEVLVSGDVQELGEYVTGIPSGQDLMRMHMQGFRRLCLGYQRSDVAGLVSAAANVGINVEVMEDEDIDFTTALRTVFGFVK